MLASCFHCSLLLLAKKIFSSILTVKRWKGDGFADDQFPSGLIRFILNCCQFAVAVHLELDVVYFYKETVVGQ